MRGGEERVEAGLPPRFSGWFRSRGWEPRPFQVEMLAAARDGAHVLLTAPTGGGKTLAGFLPSLVELAARAELAAPLKNPAERVSGNPVIKVVIRPGD